MDLQMVGVWAPCKTVGKYLLDFRKSLLCPQPHELSLASHPYNKLVVTMEAQNPTLHNSIGGSLCKKWISPPPKKHSPKKGYPLCTLDATSRPSIAVMVASSHPAPLPEPPDSRKRVTSELPYIQNLCWMARGSAKHSSFRFLMSNKYGLKVWDP